MLYLSQLGPGKSPDLQADTNHEISLSHCMDDLQLVLQKSADHPVKSIAFLVKSQNCILSKLLHHNVTYLLYFQAVPIQ